MTVDHAPGRATGVQISHPALRFAQCKHRPAWLSSARVGQGPSKLLPARHNCLDSSVSERFLGKKEVVSPILTQGSKRQCRRGYSLVGFLILHRLQHEAYSNRIEKPNAKIRRTIPAIGSASDHKSLILQAIFNIIVSSIWQKEKTELFLDLSAVSAKALTMLRREIR